MKRHALYAVAILMVALGQLRAEGVSVTQPSYAAGRPLARIAFVDDDGRIRSTGDWRGMPAILAPIYTRCPLACPIITTNLVKGVAESNARLGSYRVILFSFDPRDTPVDLRKFRERHHVPLSWTIATAQRDDIRTLMDSIDFRYGEVRGAFTHPNLIVFLTPDLQTARYLFGTNYPGSEIDSALTTARGRQDWIERFGGIALALLLFVCTLSAVYLVFLIGRARQLAAHA